MASADNATPADNAAAGARARDCRGAGEGGQAPALLVAAGVGKRFVDGGEERWPLAGVDCTVAKGATVALWGPSGSGKSTLLKVLAGILTPDAGRVLFQEADGGCFEVSAAAEPDRVRYRRRCVGFVFQAFNLVDTLTVAENVLLPLALNGLRKEREAALGRLAVLGVDHCQGRFPATLSAGEQQRVAIARALAHRPPLLLADEPTGNLDRANAEGVAAMLLEAAAEAGSALVVATHSERIAARAEQVIDLGSRAKGAKQLPGAAASLRSAADGGGLRLS